MESTNYIRFTPKTIKFSEIMELSELVYNFIKSSNMQEVIKNSSWFQGNQKDFDKLFIEIPNAIFSNKDNLNNFHEIIKFCISEDFDNNQEVENMQVIIEVITFLKDVGLLSFLAPLTILLISMIKG